MGFGQHQTFYLRQQWLNKGLKEVRDKPRFFYEEDHFEILGVGKNMAKSIRYWLNATQLAREVRSTKTEVVTTAFGDIVSEYDPYIKSKYTLSILHYLLVTEKNEATAWYWFFNSFNERVFSKSLVTEQLMKWVEEDQAKKVSVSTLKKDIDCLVLLYTAKEYKNQTPEDVIKSPFEALGLIQQTTGTNFIKTKLDINLTSSVLYTTLIKYFEKHNVAEVSLNDLVSGEELWGRVFNLNRDSIIEYIEEMKDKYPVVFTRTNRLDMIRLNKKVDFLTEVAAIYENEVFVL